MSECPHCRAPDKSAHRHDCSVAKKTGAERAPAPVPPLYLGAVICFDNRAAIVISLKPLTLRVLSPGGVDEDYEVNDPKAWSWTAGR